MKIITICGALLAFLGAAYLYIQSDVGLLGEALCLKIASTDVLDNPLYGQSCPRSSYADDVKNLNAPGNTAALFLFLPVVGKEIQCPPVKVIVDRKTGETWIEKL